MPIFVLLSGSLNLSSKNNINAKEYYKKQIIKTIIPTLIFSFLYVLFSFGITLYENGFSFNAASIKGLLVLFYEWAVGKPYYHLWYMYMYIGLILITPPTIYVIGKINDNKKILILGWFMVILGFVINLTSILFWIIQFISYIGYYILGYALKEKTELKKKSAKNIKYILYFKANFLFISLSCRDFKNIKYNIIEIIKYI